MLMGMIVYVDEGENDYAPLLMGKDDHEDARRNVGALLWLTRNITMAKPLAFQGSDGVKKTLAKRKPSRSLKKFAQSL